MSRMSLSAHPFLLGFEQVERMLERAAKGGSDGYPPYNIALLGAAGYRITLAVAGFRESDLEVTVEAGSMLVVTGRALPEAADAEILHRGIASRQFRKSFVLAEGVDVTRARLEHGLLHIDLTKEAKPAEPQRIAIADGADG